LVVFRARKAGAVAADLALRALVVEEARSAATVETKIRGALVVTGAGNAGAVLTEIGETLFVLGTRGTRAVEAETARTSAGILARGEDETAVNGAAGRTVPGTVVALFPPLEGSVAAGGDDTGGKLAIGGAEGCRGSVAETVVAPFVILHDAVAADTRIGKHRSE
jgi:hypothetical protein